MLLLSLTPLPSLRPSTAPWPEPHCDSQVLFRADRYGLVHAALGKADFSDESLSENIEALMAALVAAKPKGLKAKGGGGQGYIKSAHLASTMGRGSVGLAVGQFLK